MSMVSAKPRKIIENEEIIVEVESQLVKQEIEDYKPISEESTLNKFLVCFHLYPF
jgi:hypothetical protein